MKTRLKIYIALLAALCTIMPVLTGCDISAPSASEEGKGNKLVLTINSIASRTIQPSAISFTDYVVHFYNIDGGYIDISMEREIAVGGSLYELHNVPTGHYRLIVTAKDGPTEVAEGESLPFTITEGNVASTSVTLLPKAGVNGTFHYQIQINSALGVVSSLRIGSGSWISIPQPGGQNYISGTQSLPAGRYEVVFRFVRGGKTAYWPELLDIYSHKESNFTGLTIDADFFTTELVDEVIRIIKTGDLASIVQAHFSTLGVNSGSVGDFNVLKDNIAELYNVAVPLENITQLKALVDAANVKTHVTGSYTTPINAESFINPRILNGTSYTRPVTNELDGRTAVIGGYEVAVDISTVPEAGEMDGLLNSTFVREGLKLWSLTDQNVPFSELPDPLVSSGGTHSFTTWSSTNGINITSRSSALNGIDIGVEDPVIFPLDKKMVKISVYGIVLGTAPAGMQVALGESSESYDKLGNEGVGYQTVPTGNYSQFKLSCEVPRYYLTEGVGVEEEPQTAIRVMTNDVGAGLSLRITLIEVEDTWPLPREVTALTPHATEEGLAYGVTITGNNAALYIENNNEYSVTPELIYKWYFNGAEQAANEYELHLFSLPSGKHSALAVIYINGVPFSQLIEFIIN